MGTNYTEIFEIEYVGKIFQLTEQIKEQNGVKKANTTQPPEWKTLEYEITYDTELTDRTQIATQIEQIEGVQKVTFA